MTLDEAINKEEALAYSFGERYKRLGEPVGDLQELEAEHKQYAKWLKELKARRRIDKLNHIILMTAQYQMPEDLEQMRNEIKELEKLVEEVNADE